MITKWSNEKMENPAEIRRKTLATLVARDGLANAAKKFGKPDRQLNDMLAGRKSFGEKVARAMELKYAPDRPTGWLSNPDDLPPYQEPITHLALTNNSATFNVLDIRASCGNGFVNTDYPEIVRTLIMSPDEAIRLVGSVNRKGAIQIITASNDSMTPTIQPDDLLFVDTSIKEYAGEAIYIICHGGELVCKRISLVGQELTVISDNKFFPSWLWDSRPDETMIVGRVIRALPMTFKKFGSAKLDD